ncbi:unnamed protein product [Alopecurus aequalis]
MGEFHDSFDLVECDSNVLVVVSKYTDERCFGNMLVYRLADLVLDRVVPVTSVGGSALVIGNGITRNLSLSCGAAPSVTGDTIVSRHPLTGDPQLYQLSSGTWSRAAGDITDGGNVVWRPCSIINHLYGRCDCTLVS